MQRTQSTGLKTNNYLGLFENESKKWSNQIGAATVRQKTLAWDVLDRPNGENQRNEVAMTRLADCFHQSRCYNNN